MQRKLPLLTAALVLLGLLSLGGLVPQSYAADPEVSFAVQTLKEENVEGPNVDRTYFLAAGKKIVFGTPNGCQFRVSDTGFLLVPTEEGVSGEIQVTRSPSPIEKEFVKDTLFYREIGTKNLPTGASNVEVQTPELDSYPYNGWKSIGFTWTYSTSGRAMVRNVSFINLEVGVQVMVTTTAPTKDADKVKKLAQEFISSWWVKE